MKLPNFVGKIRARVNPGAILHERHRVGTFMSKTPVTAGGISPVVKQGAKGSVLPASEAVPAIAGLVVVAEKVGIGGTESVEEAADVSFEAAEISQGSVNMAGGVPERTTSDDGETGQNLAIKVEEFGLIAKVAAAADAVNVTADSGEKSHEIGMVGNRSAVGFGRQVADIGIGRSHHPLASAVQAMDVYRDASDRTAVRVQALFSSYMTFGRGWSHMQHAWLEMVDYTIENATHKPQDLLRCKTMTELAKVQRDLYIDAVNHAVASTNRLFEIAEQTAQEAARPLQSNVH